MKINMYAVGLLASLVLAGCNGNSESAGPITVNVEGDNIDNSVTNNNTDDTASDTSNTVTTGLCAQVVQADFISFNDDCTVGTITGTIDTDYTLFEEVQYILSGVSLFKMCSET